MYLREGIFRSCNFIVIGMTGKPTTLYILYAIYSSKNISSSVELRYMGHPKRS